MDSTAKQYYQSNTLLLSAVGINPFQSKVSSYFALFVFWGITGTQLYCKIAFVVLAWPNVDVIIQCTSPILIDIMCIIKLLNCILNLKKIQKLLEKMIFIKDSTLNAEECKIMENHAKSSKKFTLLWSTYLYSVLTIFYGLPLLPQMLGTIGNNTRQLLAPVHYYVDLQQYYYTVFAHSFATAFLFLTSLIAADSMFAALVEHACGMFSVVCYRLRNVVISGNEDTHSTYHEELSHKNFIDCINRHRKAIKFAEDIEYSHAKSFLFTAGANMLIISFTGAQIVANADKLHLMLSQSALVTGQMCHLYMENYYAQKLLDHSESVYTSIFNIDWYNASLKMKKLFVMLMMRSLMPSVLTIGGMYVMSLANFSVLLRSSVSYFTLLRSFQ